MNKRVSIALPAAILAVAVPGAAASSASGDAGSKLRVIITEQGRTHPFPPHGKFVLEGAAGRDSGTTRITPSEGPHRVRDGQSFQKADATEFLTGEHGKLTFTWTGVRVSAGSDVDILYGTWRILGGFGTGTYKDWKGGGRWAATESGDRYSIRFEGLVTR